MAQRELAKQEKVDIREQELEETLPRFRNKELLILEQNMYKDELIKYEKETFVWCHVKGFTCNCKPMYGM